MSAAPETSTVPAEAVAPTVEATPATEAEVPHLSSSHPIAP